LIQRELTKQEAENLYYKHRDSEYFRKLVTYAVSGDSVVLLLSSKEGDPISKFKELCGDKDPKLAKENTLRRIYGMDIVKNEIYSSDDQTGANKDRDIFKFPLP
jgi:nucleoside-diphosphate kinase